MDISDLEKKTLSELKFLLASGLKGETYKQVLRAYHAKKKSVESHGGH